MTPTTQLDRTGRAGRVLVSGLVAFSLVSPALAAAGSPNRLDLAGAWTVRLDPEDVGVKQQWFQQELPNRIKLPGSLQEQGLGREVSIDTQWTGDIVDRSWFTSPRYAKYRRPGNVKVPFWLQPQRHYVGAAWYQRTVTVPDHWAGKRMVLSLERCHWGTTVWVDGRRAGSADSLSAPHTYDLTHHMGPGAHRLTIRVDNRLIVDVGPNSHSVTDHTQSNWNGVVGRIELRATDRVWINDVQVYPDVAGRSAKVKITIGNATGGGGRGTLSVKAQSYNTDRSHNVAGKQVSLGFGTGASTTVELDYPLGDGVQLWDEFQPALYRMAVKLDAKRREVRHADEVAVTFGMRSIATKGTQFVLNGRPISLRGTLECCIFPLTGYPPPDAASWRRIIRVCKAHGLNHIRFHSWCPPEAAFAAADELGFYYHVECASWANQGASLGEGKPIDRWLYAEADRILRAYGNHPSFLLMAYGNEPAGPGRGAKYLGPWVTHYREKDPRRLYTSAAGWPVIPENQYHSTPGPRIHQWGAGVRSRINARPPETVTDYRDFIRRHRVPVVSHEIGQWCVYPNFDEMAKYTGVLRPKNFEIFREFLEANQMGDQARDFLMASGKLQAICYKEEIESALRTAGMGGFQLLDLHDFPGQGTALVGVLDPFWDSKPYLTPDEFRRFCDQTVPLARLPKRIFTSDETLSAAVGIYHFGPADLEEAVVTWRLVTERGQAVASGQFPARRIVTGRLTEIGPINVPLGKSQDAQELRLVVGVEGTPAENDWDIWVYPPRIDTRVPGDVLIVDHLNEQALGRLKAGGKVLLMLPPRRVRGDVVIGFSSVFWNTAWTRNQPPHTLGILCNPRHPALAEFPTEYHTNWQWWELVSRSGAMVLDDLPPGLRPVVQVIDTWFEARRLGLIFEAKVAGGRLIVCSIDLERDLDRRPAARQMRHSLLQYMAGARFDPGVEVSVEAIRRLVRPPSKMEQLGATATADSEMDGYPASHAVDDNPGTIWHTPWGEKATAMPHHLVIDLKESRSISGLSCLPRQDMANGRIAEFAVYLSDDGRSWGGPVAAGTWPNTSQVKRLRFRTPHTARYVKLVARSEVGGNVFASAAEVEVITQ